ncbi:MAG: hypothetical protein ACF8GE_11835 [Phycisphaerales bacterium JB043]
MNIRALTIAAGLAAATSANAGLIGFEARSAGDIGFGERFDIYAIFDEAVQVLNIFEANWVSDANFFQSGAPFGADTAPNSGFFGFDASLESDSYVTIGDTDSADGDDTTTDPDFAFGPNTVSGGWFDADPGTTDGQTDINNEVIVGRLTVVGARGDSGPMSGTAGVTWKDGSGATVQDIGAFIPTPGAMALFGLAGLTAGRRRR